MPKPAGIFSRKKQQHVAIDLKGGFSQEAANIFTKALKHNGGRYKSQARVMQNPSAL